MNIESEEYTRLMHKSRLYGEKQENLDSVDRLLQLSEHNMAVRAHLDAWRSGRFGSFEQMLCQLCLHLAVHNKELREQVLCLLQTSSVQLPYAPPTKEIDRET